jgi:hypothetical protein
VLWIHSRRPTKIEHNSQKVFKLDPETVDCVDDCVAD